MTTVYGVYRNSDMTEGRGPMFLESLWTTETAAWEYANRQLGVMGRKGTRDHRWAEKNPMGTPYPGDCPGWQCQYCWEYAGDWSVRALELRSE